MNMLLSIEDVKKLQEARSTCVVLLCGETENDEIGYAYVLMHTHKLNEVADLLEEDEDEASIDITELGKVLAHGVGQPPDTLQERMFTEWHFGFTHTNARFFPND